MIFMVLDGQLDANACVIIIQEKEVARAFLDYKANFGLVLKL